MMRWYSEYKHPDQWHFIIKHDNKAGFYLYVYEHADLFYEDVKDTARCSRHQQDHLQDTLEIAKEQAFEDFGVPLDSWVQVK